MWDVIILGGGYTGVTAAVEIERRMPGARVLLLEAADRLGGRARSVEVPTREGAPKQSLDVGAHYFGPQHRRVNALARRLLPPESVFAHPPIYGENPAFRCYLEGGFRTSTKKDSYLEMQGLDKDSPWYDRISIFKSLAFYLMLENLIDVREPWRTPLAEALDRTTVAEWIADQEVPDWIREMWGLACLDILSIHPEKISLLYWAWYHASNQGFLHVAHDFDGGPQERSVDIGMGGLLERYAAEIRGEVRLSSPVTAVDHSAPDRVIVTTRDGAVHEARRVIVAVSPAAAGRHIQFSPALHPARERLHRQPMGHAAKAIVVYREPWWWNSRGYQYYGISCGPFAEGVEWLMDTSHADGRQYSLTAFVGRGFFERRRGATDEELKRAIAEELVQVVGDERAADYAHIEIFRWASAPHVGGGPNTSMEPGVLSTLAPIFNCAEGPHGRLFFASSEYATEFTGYVEGAMAAGEQVAAHIAGAASLSEAPAARAELPRALGRRPRYAMAFVFLLAWVLLLPLAALTRLAWKPRWRRDGIATELP